MVSRKELLNNLREYSSDQIVEAINAGVVTLYDLSKSGNLTPLMRKRIEQKLSDTATAVESNNLHSEEVDTPVIAETTQDVAVNNKSVEEVAPIVSETSTELGNVQVSVDEGKDNLGTESETLSNKGMFKRPFSFKGRIRRLEYGFSYLIYLLWYVVTEAMMQGSEPSAGACIFTLATIIPMIWFLWAQGAKRCHDRGNSGWYQIIPFYFFWMLFADGEKGTNNYGENPKE